MPNWNDNIVNVYGCDDEINRLIEMGTNGGKDEEFQMNNILPTPLNEDGEVADGWYGWRVDNWGSKWDMSAVNMEQCNRMVTLTFQTPWAPNNTFWDFIAEEFPTLEIELSYYEGGMVFCGHYLWMDGKNVEDNHFDFEDMEGDTELEKWECFAEMLNSLGFGWAAEEVREYTIPSVIEEMEEEAA